MEQPVGHLHDVVFHEAGDLLAVVPAGVFEGVADDLLAARPRDQLDARGHFRRELVFDAGVQILLVLAHDHHVHVGMLGVDERVIGNARPHVGIQAQGLAGGHVEALEAAALRRGDGSLQKDFGAQERRPGAGFNAGRVAAQIDFFANLDGFDLQSRAGRFQDLQRGVHDFRTDAVAMGDGDGSFGGHREI